jgi:hypothetical protein
VLLNEKNRFLKSHKNISGIDYLRFLSGTDLNILNEALLHSLQRGGDVFLSNAIVNEKYCLRGCIVNFRTTEKDIQ